MAVFMFMLSSDSVKACPPTKSAKLCNLLAACFENKVAKYINRGSRDASQDISETARG